MPFKHSDELHQNVLYNTKFESDECYEMEDEEKDKFLIDVLCKQNELLNTMQKTIHKLTKAFVPN